MKHTLHIAILSLSTLLIAILPYIPHHHHDGVACMAKELCAQDHQYNDEHTSHHDQGTHDSSTCIKHISALKVTQSDTDSRRLIPIYPILAFLPSDCHSQPAIHQESTSPQGTQFRNHSSLADTPRSLRAPPHTV